MHANDLLVTLLRRIQEEWLPTYCKDPRRKDSSSRFKPESIKLDAADADYCMRAIDLGIVKDTGHGRFRAANGTASEPLFWEGPRHTSPRSITFWHEPAITFAALARLHLDYGWPSELLGNQPKGWAFDLAAHDDADRQYRILGEVKKTRKEAEALVADLQLASARQSTDGLSQNSAKKWQGLLRDQPPLLWIVGPAGFERAFSCSYRGPDVCYLQDCPVTALRFPSA